jgi:hypothetical protein
VSIWDTLLMSFAAVSSTALPGDQKPITLMWQTNGDLVEVRVVGSADKALRLTYVLDVSGTSTTRTSGIANLVPGTSKTFSTVRVRPVKGWQATLIVSGDVNYTIRQPG